MIVCTSLQTDNHASSPPLSFLTGRMPFLPPNQQWQSTEGEKGETKTKYKNGCMQKKAVTVSDVKLGLFQSNQSSNCRIRNLARYLFTCNQRHDRCICGWVKMNWYGYWLSDCVNSWSQSWRSERRLLWEGYVEKPGMEEWGSCGWWEWWVDRRRSCSPRKGWVIVWELTVSFPLGISWWINKRTRWSECFESFQCLLIKLWSCWLGNGKGIQSVLLAQSICKDSLLGALSYLVKLRKRRPVKQNWQR